MQAGGKACGAQILQIDISQLTGHRPEGAVTIRGFAHLSSYGGSFAQDNANGRLSKAMHA